MKDKKIPSWIITLITLTAVGVLTAFVGGYYILDKVERGYLKTLAEENEEDVFRIANELGKSFREGGDRQAQLTQFQSNLMNAPMDPASFVCLMDQNARVLSHPDPNMVGADMASASVNSLNGTIQGSLDQVVLDSPRRFLLETRDFNGDPHLVIQSPIEGTDWRVSFHSDLSVVDQRVRDLKQDLMRAGIPVIAVFILIATAAIRRVENTFLHHLEKANEDLELKVADRTSELKKTLNQLEVARHAAESADRLKAEFLAVMNHEYRTPLNGILGFSSILLEDETLGEEQIDSIRGISESGERLNYLIERILYFTEIEANEEVRIIDKVPVGPWLSSIAENTARRWAEKDIEFKITLGEGTEEKVGIAKSAVERMTTELLDNAFKFTESGEIELSMSVKSGSEKQLSIEITDTGCGVDPENPAHEGKLFQLGDSSDSRNHQGMGLGLVMVRRMEEKSGAKVEISPRLDGKGTQVLCTFPVEG
jgi:signal transduction histidine kinase